MKHIHFAIASIVDANTGYGYSRSGDRIDYAAAERSAHRVRARSIADLLGAAKQRIAASIEAFRQYSQRRRELRHLQGLNEHLLRDIGLSRADLFAIEAGLTSLERLDAERKARSVKAQPAQQVRIASGEADAAANREHFVAAKCA